MTSPSPPRELGDAHNAGVTNAGGWENLALLVKAGISATKEVEIMDPIRFLVAPATVWL